jgi:hypothetical protein
VHAIDSRLPQGLVEIRCAYGLTRAVFLIELPVSTEVNPRTRDGTGDKGGPRRPLAKTGDGRCGLRLRPSCRSAGRCLSGRGSVRPPNHRDLPGRQQSLRDERPISMT